MRGIQRLVIALIKLGFIFASIAFCFFLIITAAFYLGGMKAADDISRSCISCKKPSVSPVKLRMRDRDGFFSSKDWRIDLPSVTTEPELAPELYLTEYQSIAAGRVDYYRNLAGIKQVTLNDNLNRAAQAHAEYNNRHGLSGHTEKSGQAGFSGVWPWDRMKSFDYRRFTYATEVCSVRWVSSNYPLTIDPDWAVDSWIDTVYHRLAILNPNIYEAGFGASKKGGRVAYVMDFANPGFPTKKQIICYPVNGQYNVPSEFTGDEIPDPLPGKRYPVGYPVTVTFSGYKNIKVKEIKLLDEQGNNIAFYKLLPFSNKYIQDTLAIIPKYPLRNRTVYRMIVHATADGRHVNLDWHFRTR